MKAYPAPVLWSTVGAVVVTGGLASFGWQSYRQSGVNQPVAAIEAPQQTTASAPAPPTAGGSAESAAKPADTTKPAAEGQPAAPAATQAAPAAQNAPATPDLPSFDVARVERDGSAVVAGRAEPGSVVALMDGLAEIARGNADDNGQFAFVPKNLTSGNHLLTLRMTVKDQPAVDSKQTVTVVVPESEKKDFIVALTQPGVATKVLSDPFKPAADGEVAIRSVEAEAKGEFYASGSAAPGARVWLYLNDTFVAAVTAGSDGLWSLKIEKGVTPGRYDVRADAVAGDGKVLSRAGVTFQMGETSTAAAKPGGAASQSTPAATQATATPAAGAQPTAAPASKNASTATPANAQAAAASQAAAPPPANVVVPEISTAQVKRGDSLWRISRKVYGAGLRYTQIYEANTTQIRNPNLIFPGQIFVLPKDSKG